MKHISALRRLAMFFLLTATVFLTGCATHYLDKGTTEAPVSEFKKPASVQPAQLIFEFQTNGAPNARATAYLKERVLKQALESGLFSELTETPVSSGALLSITLNNVANLDEAMKKGFLTGLTLGVKGSTVTDGYVCTLKYLPPNTKEPITKTAQHAIYTTMGSDPAVEKGLKVDNVQEGVHLMVRQILSQVFKSLSHDPAFK